MAKRCLIVTYYFPPQGGGGVQRIAKLIKYLSRDNWQFTVICGKNPFSELPDDNSLLADIPPKTEIIRVSNSVNRKNESLLEHFKKTVKSTYLIRWISSFLFIPDIRKGWLKPVKNTINNLLQSQKFDMVLISSPPYSLALLAAELTESLSIPVVLDMRDPWTTNPYKIHPTYWHYKSDRKYELQAISSIRYGVSAYQNLLDFYQDTIKGFKKSDWKFIPNGFDNDDFNLLEAVSLDKNKFHIAFSGTFYSHLNRPQFLFKAMALLDKETKEKICFHHVGNSMLQLKKIAAKYGLQKNITEWGYKPHGKCLNILAGMDAFCFILDSANKNACNTIGGKVYEYLRLKKPILALIPEKGEAARLILHNEAGVVIDPYNRKEIGKILSSWVNKKPEFTFDPYSSTFERSKQAKMYGNFLYGILLGNSDNS